MNEAIESLASANNIPMLINIWKFAATNRDGKDIRKLIGSYIPLLMERNGYPKEDWTFKELIERLDFDSLSDPDDQLLCAVKFDSVDFVKRAIDNGAVMFEEAVDMTVYFGSLEVCKYLVGDMDITTSGQILDYNGGDRHLAVIKYCVENHILSNRSRLLTTAFANGDAKIIEYLLRNKEKVMKDDVLLSAANGHMKIFNMYSDKVNVKSDDLLPLAIKTRNVKLTNSIIDVGVRNWRAAMKAAISIRDEDLVRRISQYTSENFLPDAILSGDEKIINMYMIGSYDSKRSMIAAASVGDTALSVSLSLNADNRLDLCVEVASKNNRVSMMKVLVNVPNFLYTDVIVTSNNFDAVRVVSDNFEGDIKILQYLVKEAVLADNIELVKHLIKYVRSEDVIASIRKNHVELVEILINHVPLNYSFLDEACKLNDVRIIRLLTLHLLEHYFEDNVEFREELAGTYYTLLENTKKYGFEPVVRYLTGIDLESAKVKR